MKIYLELPIEDRGLQRVYDALVKYAPQEATIVKDESEADLVVIHVTGDRDKVKRRIDDLKSKQKKYAIIQYVLRSSQKPDTHDWLDLWLGAQVVWSYYYLPELCFEDGIVINSLPFYYAPLGSDPTVFYDRKTKPGHTACVIATCSKHALSESVRECVFASKRVNRRLFHLGHDLRRGDDIFCKTNISDNELAYYYSCCEFVSGLRRIEGFELPAVEGLLCGARPILFDRPHYRAWFDGLAVFIPENSRSEVIDSLEKVFLRGAKPVTEQEIEEAKRRFNWQTIITGFYERILV